MRNRKEKITATGTNRVNATHADMLLQVRACKDWAHQRPAHTTTVIFTRRRFQEERWSIPFPLSPSPRGLRRAHCRPTIGWALMPTSTEAPSCGRSLLDRLGRPVFSFLRLLSLAHERPVLLVPLLPAALPLTACSQTAPPAHHTAHHPPFSSAVSRGLRLVPRRRRFTLKR